jgi:hypothetical protein
MKEIILAASIAVLLSGCVQQQAMIWQNSTKPDTAFAGDRWSCLHDASAVAPPATATSDGPFGPFQYDINEDNRDNLYIACMNAKNWRWVPARPAVSIASGQQ